ncbi:MAG: hypothetical protein C0456_18050 [Hyphomonas sp.]|uniref:PRC-barrel domain-containing protein n=1 Tax=Hyphomonas sp. TaxID=87 RepID=UPI001DB1C8BF|nr:PRC-barrel domain-containing protein [Hyphomonas sp.]MBA4228515.1 hypothetical protein [Hyphomonas sp.]
MKTLLATASATVLLLGAAACSPAEGPAATNGYETRGPQVVEYDDATVETANADAFDSVRAEYRLAQGEIEASDLIGASVRNGADEEIATVADLYLGEDGASPVILIRDGGVAGVGGELRQIAFTSATVTAPANDEPEVLVQIAEETLETLPAFEQDGMNDYRLASEIMGATTPVSFREDDVRITDLILTNSGELRYAVISPSLASTDQFVVRANAIRVAEGDSDGDVVLDMDEAEFDEAPMYRWE